MATTNASRTPVGEPVRIVSQDGVQGTVDITALDGAGRMLIRLATGRHVWAPAEFIIPQADGSYRLALGLLSLAEASEANNGAQVVIVPVVAETLEVSKRTAQHGVRVTKQVQEQTRWVDEAGYREEIDIERVAVNRVLDAPLPVRYEGDTVIVPLMEEALVVEKRLVLKEELRITKRRHETRTPQRVVLRQEVATVEPMAADGASPGEDGYPATDRA